LREVFYCNSDGSGDELGRRGDAKAVPVEDAVIPFAIASSFIKYEEYTPEAQRAQRWKRGQERDLIPIILSLSCLCDLRGVIPN